MSLRLLLPLVLTVFLTGCKSEFERVRLSGNVDMIYQKGVDYYEKGEYQKAQTLFEIIINNFRGKKEAEDLYFKYANTHFFLKNYLLSAYYFNNFTTTYPLSNLKEEAEYMVAFSYYRLSPIFRLDQAYTRKSIDGFQDFVNNHPRSERVEECNRLMDILRAKLERKAYEEAKLYYDLREYQASLQSFENLLRDFPETRDAERIRFLMVEAAHAWAANSIREKRQERYEKALEFIQVFRNKYPGSSYKEDLRKIETLTQTALKNL